MIVEAGREWELLRDMRTVAVVARSDRTDRPWHSVASYLIEAGYRVYLVNPLLDEALGRRCYDCVRDLPERLDLVDVFRRMPEVPSVVEDAIAAEARAVWLQLGIVHDEAAERACAAGLWVVMDRCTQVEHRWVLAGRLGGRMLSDGPVLHSASGRSCSREGCG